MRGVTASSENQVLVSYLRRLQKKLEGLLKNNAALFLRKLTAGTASRPTIMRRNKKEASFY